MPLSLPAARPVGTVVFFHGCARLSNGYFPYNPTACPECIGLPEELALTKQVGAEGVGRQGVEARAAGHMGKRGSTAGLLSWWLACISPTAHTVTPCTGPRRRCGAATLCWPSRPRTSGRSAGAPAGRGKPMTTRRWGRAVVLLRME